MSRRPSEHILCLGPAHDDSSKVVAGEMNFRAIKLGRRFCFETMDWEVPFSTLDFARFLCFLSYGQTSLTYLLSRGIEERKILEIKMIGEEIASLPYFKQGDRVAHDQILQIIDRQDPAIFAFIARIRNGHSSTDHPAA